ncbi:MAG: putative molybdenum carrier protein [Gammaproteobacteria bacterium]
MKKPEIMRILSGGQTGVDRAALDTALQLGIPCGGWCPRGRRAEDGPIPAHYPLRELDSECYGDRTERNVLDADGTLILVRGVMDGGTALTARWADRNSKPRIIIDLQHPPRTEIIYEWMVDNRIEVLNVAGPRESKQHGIYTQAKGFLLAVFCFMKKQTSVSRPL